MEGSRARALGSLGSATRHSKSSARLDAPSGNGIAVLILNLELYGERRRRHRRRSGVAGAFKQRGACRGVR